MDAIVHFTDPGFNGDDHIGESGLEGQHMRTLQKNTEERRECPLPPYTTTTRPSAAPSPCKHIGKWRALSLLSP